MWLLISERGESFLITPKEEHIISRKGGSITLSDDQSISRLHAKIILNNDDSNSDFGLTLVDTSSKYGTYVNDGIETSTRIPDNEKILLNHDDHVRFGLQWNKWRVVFMPLFVLTSTLKQPEKQLVKLQVEKLGGRMISNWSSNCTHLTMNQITLTVKVVSVLGAGQHIVTPKYWQNLLLAVQTKQGSVPDPTDYIPPLNEATLNENQISFKVNKNRSTLFKDKLFVATSPRQKSRINPMVTSAGGNVTIFDECNLTEGEFCNEGVILMQSSPSISPSDQQSEIPAAYHAVSKYLSSKKLRCIPESDIGLCVVYCSCEKFCNPRYNAQSIFECHPAPLQQTESLPVIAQDTQNSPCRPTGIGKVLDDTIAAIASLSGKSNKRPSSDDVDEDSRPFKKPTIDEDEQFLQDVSSYKVEKLVPGIVENDIFVYNFEAKNNQEDNNDDFQRKNNDNLHNKKIVKETENDENLRDDNQSEEIFKNKSCKKRSIISDDEDDGKEFCLPSQRRKIDDSTSKDIKINKKDKEKNVVVIDDSSEENDDDDFSFSRKKKQVSKSSSCLFDSERDIFDPSLKNNNNIKSLKSVDMFATMSSRSSNRNNPSTSFVGTSKDSVDIFDFAGSSKKSSRNIKDNDFEFTDVRSSEKNSNDALQENNVFKCPKTVNIGNDDLIKENESPFQSNKLSRDIFEPTTSDGRGVKRKTSVDEPITKKLNVMKEETESNNINQINGNSSLRKSPERILNEEEIKKEPIDATIKDEELHDSTVIVVKSLIAPMKNIAISNHSKGKKKTSVNFKNFKKVTPLKMPNLIDLIAYEERNNGCWANITLESDDDEDNGKDDGWSFRQSQSLKASKSRKAR